MMLIIARSSFWPPFLPQTEFVVMEFWTRLAIEGSTQVELRFDVQFEMKNSRFRKFNVSFGFRGLACSRFENSSVWGLKLSDSFQAYFQIQFPLTCPFLLKQNWIYFLRQSLPQAWDQSRLIHHQVDWKHPSNQPFWQQNNFLFWEKNFFSDPYVKDTAATYLVK